MNKLREYFVGKLIDNNDVLSDARVIVIFNITLYSVILTLFLFSYLLITANWILAIRALVSILISTGLLFYSKKIGSFILLVHFLINITGLVIISNCYFIFQEIDYSTFCLYVALTVFSYIVLSKNQATFYSLVYGASMVIVIYWNSVGFQWTDIPPQKPTPLDQVLASITGIILIIYTLWEFYSAVAKLSQRLQEQNEELLMAKKSAEEMIRLKSSFLANMSHEIRTPINGIMGLAEVLKNEYDNPEAKKIINMQRESSKRLLATINSILELAKLESGRESITLSDIPAKKIVKQAFDLLKPLADEKGLDMTVCFENEGITCHASEEIMNQILNNIIGNAIKFTEKGSISIKVESNTDYSIIHVMDTGIGISQDFLPKIFDSFVQESDGIGRSHEGTGLGLSISMKYMEMIGGDIRVESKKGAGSTFTLNIPSHPI